MSIKFASLPVKYAPKRKHIGFVMPAWKNKMGEFEDLDIHGWVNNLYQEKIFKTQEAFNKAYDEYIANGCPAYDVLNWNKFPMVLTSADVESFEEALKGGGFEHSTFQAEKVLKKMRAALETGEKVLVVY